MIMTMMMRKRLPVKIKENCKSMIFMKFYMAMMHVPFPVKWRSSLAVMSLQTTANNCYCSLLSTKCSPLMMTSTKKLHKKSPFVQTPNLMRISQHFPRTFLEKQLATCWCSAFKDLLYFTFVESREMSSINSRNCKQPTLMFQMGAKCFGKSDRINNLITCGKKWLNNSNVTVR